MVLIPVTISPYGSWEPMLHKLLFGKMCSEPYRFPATHPNASCMYKRAMSHPCPVGVIPLAASTWKKNKPKHQYFYGHSYTCPTPREYILQQMGLVIYNSITLHVRDTKQGTLVEPTDPDDEDSRPDDSEDNADPATIAQWIL